MKLSLTTFFAVFALALFAERQPIERYQPIIDRSMFGRPPPGFDPTKPSSEVSKSDTKTQDELQAQANIKTAIRFSAINVTPEGSTAVGFTDSSDAKNPVHYYLKVGESRNGWLVKDADPVKATMTIAKDDVEVMLSIGGNSAQADASVKGNTPRALGGSGLLSRRTGLATSQQPGTPLSSLRGRRLLREQQRQADAAEAEAKKEAEAQRQAEAQRREEEERAQRAAEREEQRTQLLQIQEELRKAREARAAQEAALGAGEENGGSDAEQE